jgi:hypothetical protein
MSGGPMISTHNALETTTATQVSLTTASSSEDLITPKTR